MIELSKLGPFALETRLGTDESSRVFHGFHLKQKRQAVVCILPERYAENPRARRRLQKRSHQLQKLNHPNIVRYHGAGIDKGIPFFALDYVDGISLQQYLEQHGPLPWETVVDIGLQICSALSAAHALNIHHLDIRPAHILLSGEGLTDPRKPLKVQLTSFWADPAWRRSALLLLPKDRQQYLSPEQFDDPQYVDDASDIFSLGCVLYEAVTGKLPFDPLATGEQRWQTPDRPASLELDCPVWLDRVIMRMVEIMPDRRPADIDAVASGLRESQDAVARGMSAIEHALVGNNGRESIIDIGIDRAEAQRLLAKPRRKSYGPFYEHPLFLAAVLLLVVGTVAWLLRPLNDKELLARAEPLMLTDDTTKWHVAEKEYLEPLLARYPESPLAEDARQYLDMIHMERAEARLKINLRLGREFRNDAERRLAQARSLEKNGSHLGAWYQYDQMLAELPDDAENRPYRLIADREIKRLENLKVGEGTPMVALDDFVLQAEEMILSGKEREGRTIFARIVSLYQTHPQAADAVDLAKEVLAKPVAVAARTGPAPSRERSPSSPQESLKPELPDDQASQPQAEAAPRDGDRPEATDDEEAVEQPSVEEVEQEA